MKRSLPLPKVSAIPESEETSDNEGGPGDSDVGTDAKSSELNESESERTLPELRPIKKSGLSGRRERHLFQRSKTTHAINVDNKLIPQEFDGGDGGSRRWGLFRDRSPPQKGTDNCNRPLYRTRDEILNLRFSSSANLAGENRGGKYLIRRSSYHVDFPSSDLEPEYTFVPSFLPPKAPPPTTTAVAAKKRRCSLTLPYPCLYGSWQTAIKTCTSAAVEIPMSLSSISCGGKTSPSTQEPSVPAPGNTNIQDKAPDPKILSPSSTKTTVIDMSPTSPPGLQEDTPLIEEENHCITLVAQTFQKIPMKDFGAEVRASRDITHFLNQAVLLLDVTENNLEGIVDMMLDKLLGEDEPLCSANEAKSVVFTHDSVQLLARTIQGTCTIDGGGFDYDQSWICALCNLPSLQKRRVAIARLKAPANMGRTSHEIRLFLLVLCPSKEKGTKNALETGRTFSTLFADIVFRQKLVEARTEEEFKSLMLKQAQSLSEEQTAVDKQLVSNHAETEEQYEYETKWIQFGMDIKDDLMRRLPYYLSDYKDGVVGHKTVQKVVSTTFFLYFACILPAIAFGVLNDNNTHGKIDVKKVIIGQTIGGLSYTLVSGQPLLIQLTTAPIAIFIKIIYSICKDFDIDFSAMYCCVGLWNAFFLILYALFGMSRMMRWSTRSTEEIFALFISVAFTVDAVRDATKNFRNNYLSDACTLDIPDVFNTSFNGIANISMNHSAATTLLPMSLYPKHLDNTSSLFNVSHQIPRPICHRESSLLFLLLMLGTLWLGVSLYNFNKTPYLQASKREALADYALPVAVLVLSFIGSYVFRDVPTEHFKYDEDTVFHVAPLDRLSWVAVLASMGLGFSLSLLFFMDQNITAAMVNNPCNKLKKGPAYHLDLFVVAVLNGVLSFFGLPWMHATIPHSPLHVRSLADVEERVDQGHVYEIIVKVRETRLTGIFSNVLIGLSLFLLPYPMAYIPTAVLDGLFLYMAVTALNGNQMFERITLLFMEQAAYPPNHYIRRVPQRKIHQFTGCQVVQLLFMCVVGFSPWPYLKMTFPILLLILLPIRHIFIPKLIEKRYLDALDGEHQ